MKWDGKTIGLTTVKHVGDSLALSCAVDNLKRAFPGVNVSYQGVHPEVFANNDQVVVGGPADLVLKVTYTDFGTSHFGAVKWSLCEGFTRSLAQWLQVDIPFAAKVPRLVLSEEEKSRYDSEQYRGAVVLNSNIQGYCVTKGYPWWREVVELMPDARFILIGADSPVERRIDAGGLSNVLDMRGRTTLRDLMALVSVCGCVLSPASAVVHIAAALGRPSVVVIGARESRRFTDYPGALHVHSRCVCGGGTWSGSCGCTRFKFSDAKPELVCPRPVQYQGWAYPECMVSIPPESVADAVKRQLHGDS